MTGSSRRSRRSVVRSRSPELCATNDENNTRTIDSDDGSGGDGALHQHSPTGKPCAPQTTTAMAGHSADIAPRLPRSPSTTATGIATVHFAAVAPSCAPSMTTMAAAVMGHPTNTNAAQTGSSRCSRRSVVRLRSTKLRVPQTTRRQRQRWDTTNAAQNLVCPRRRQ